jgi:hypothetical protein
MWERKQAGGLCTNVIEMALIDDGAHESINQATQRAAAAPQYYWWTRPFL